MPERHLVKSTLQSLPQDYEIACEFSVGLGAVLLLLVGIQVSWQDFIYLEEA